METDAVVAASYLGKLDYVSRQNNYRQAAEGDELVLPLYDKPEIVLFPNAALSFRLPLEWWGYMKMDMWAASSSSNLPPLTASPPGCFVVFPSVQRYPNSNKFISDVGCIAQVVGASKDREEVVGVAIGRHTCRREEMVSSKTVRVVVLNDGCHEKPSSNPELIPRGMRAEKYCFTSIPGFVCDFTSTIALSKQIFSILLSQQTWEGLRPAPNCHSETARNPVKLSYWLASILPLSFEKKADLLSTLSLRERLWKEARILKVSQSESPYLYCSRCGQRLAEKSSLFQVGSIGLHVNPHGIVHDTVTLHDVCNGCVILVGSRVSEDSWFPGYEWQVADCSVCGQHMGWCFTLCSQSSGHGMMQNFWGMRRAAMTDEYQRSTFGFSSMDHPIELRPYFTGIEGGSELYEIIFGTHV